MKIQFRDYIIWELEDIHNLITYIEVLAILQEPITKERRKQVERKQEFVC